ncbi:MAG: general secretion pathway protein GspB [Phycisphaerae bacterium]
MSAAAALRRIATFVQTWLVGAGAGGRRTSQGRWLHVGLTVTLLAAGVAAWAVALIQPWKAKAADRGIVAVRGQPAPQPVREAAEEAEQLFEPATPTVLPVLARNPFATPGLAEATDAAPRPTSAPPEEPPCPGGGAATAKHVAETARDLQLKATVRSTRGERWVVINDRVYREGDEVAGLTLVEIGETCATLRRGGVTCVIRMD